MECIVLAGGLGTRLRSSIGEYPKCMADVNGKPFLHYVFEYLREQGCTRVILSLGYMHEVVTEWVDKHELKFAVDHVIETEPLGTGGGMQLALKRATAANVAVLNGDTIFKADLSSLFLFHKEKNAEVSIALKEMKDFDRYGVVNIDSDSCITSFEEKKQRAEGLINGGIYIINKEAFLNRHHPEKFSFEKDQLEKYVHDWQFFGQVHEGYFLDIGIPEDYAKAQVDL